MAHTTESSSSSFLLYFISASFKINWRMLLGTTLLGIVVLGQPRGLCGLRHISGVNFALCRYFFPVFFDISALTFSSAVV